jgi:hypothetical protein
MLYKLNILQTARCVNPDSLRLLKAATALALGHTPHPGGLEIVLRGNRPQFKAFLGVLAPPS